MGKKGNKVKKVKRLLKKARKAARKVQKTARKYEKRVPTTVQLLGGTGQLGKMTAEEMIFGKRKGKKK